MDTEFADLPLSEILRVRARQTPSRTALIWYGRRLSWAELDRMSDRFAARLQALQLRRGEPVMLFMGNCPQFLIAHYGVLKAGGVVSPCSPASRSHELLAQASDLQARFVVAADVLLPVVLEVAAHGLLDHVFAVRYADLLPALPDIALPQELMASAAAAPALPVGCEDLLQLVLSEAGPAPEPVPVQMDDVALISYTSGSTGLPKGAMLTHGNARFKAGTSTVGHDIQQSDCVLLAAPLYHIAGMGLGVNVPVMSGATFVLLHRFEALSAAQALERYQVTWWYSTAPMNQRLMELPGAAQMDWRALRWNAVTSFGIVFNEDLATQWRAFAPNCMACESAYGLTETHTSDSLMPHDAIRWGTHGKPVPGNTMRIVDFETGMEVPRGTPGEITVHGPGNFKGYLNNPEATARTLRDGWLYTGDVGVLDDQGYLTFLGRNKEMMKVSGYSVFPEEVESILVKHAGVLQVAVVGKPDARKGEVVCAFVVARPAEPVSAADLMAWAAQNMAFYKVPREVHFIDALPATGSGKLLRRKLKEQLQGGEAAQAPLAGA